MFSESTETTLTWLNLWVKLTTLGVLSRLSFFVHSQLLNSCGKNITKTINKIMRYMYINDKLPQPQRWYKKYSTVLLSPPYYHSHTNTCTHTDIHVHRDTHACAHNTYTHTHTHTHTHSLTSGVTALKSGRSKRVIWAYSREFVKDIKLKIVSPGFNG